MIQYIVTIEYVDGVETKFGCIHKWEDVSTLINVRLDCERNAKKVKLVTICPRYTP